MSARTLAGMSFSYSAGGTKAETLDSLSKLTHHDDAGKSTADLITSMIEAGPAESQLANGVNDVIYSVSAYGHSSNGVGTPNLGITLSASYRLREEPQEDAPAGD